MGKGKINESSQELIEKLLEDEDINYNDYITSDESIEYVEDNYEYFNNIFEKSVDEEYNKFGYGLSIAIFSYGKMLAFTNDMYFTKSPHPNITDKQWYTQLSNLYNKNYLNTEEQMYKRFGSNINNYRKYYDDNKDNFVFLTKRDQKVRDEHRLYDGIVKPKDDPWWELVGSVLSAPRCRCAIRSTNKPQNDFNPDLINSKWATEPTGFIPAKEDYLWSLDSDHSYIVNYNKYKRYFNTVTKNIKGINDQTTKS